MTADARPIIAITMGDAAGIGPEIIVKALSSEQIYALCRPLVIGSEPVLRETIKLVNKPLDLRIVNTASGTQGKYGTIDLIDLHNLQLSDFSSGQICRSCGKAAIEYISRAAHLALENEVAAIVTAPINKEATKLAGCGDMGHLEYLARITGTREYATMLVSGVLRVVHLTTHHSLKEACALVTKERILGRLKLTYQSFRSWGIEHPHIAVAALNPHAGEGGLLGSEESEEIAPAIKLAHELGINALGPFPADSVFTRALKGEFDAVLAMYHDQGHIPIKVYGFEKSVSVALGLPLIRTSVDHGTAFDIAGKGIAQSLSLEEAIKMAISLATQKKLSDV